MKSRKVTSIGTMVAPASRWSGRRLATPLSPRHGVFVETHPAPLTTRMLLIFPSSDDAFHHTAPWYFNLARFIGNSGGGW